MYACACVCACVCMYVCVCVCVCLSVCVCYHGGLVGMARVGSSQPASCYLIVGASVLMYV